MSLTYIVPDLHGRLDLLQWSLVALKANHDAMMVEALRDLSRMAAWIGTGGDATLASHGGDTAAVPQAHITWSFDFG
jgi:hypothetical protein